MKFLRFRLVDDRVEIAANAAAGGLHEPEGGVGRNGGGLDQLQPQRLPRIGRGVLGWGAAERDSSE